MEKQLSHARLTIGKEKLDRLNRIMNMKPAHLVTDGRDKEMDRLIREATRKIGKESSLYSTEVWFPGGVTGEVDVYPPRDKESPAYAKATLYDAYGHKIASTIANSRLDREWLLHDNEDRPYSIDIKPARQMEGQDTLSTHFDVAVSADPDELDHLNRIMGFHDRQQDLPELDDSEIREFADSLEEKSEYLFQKEIPFPDGTHAVIRVTPADSMEDRAFAQAFLYDADGIEIGFTEPYFNLDQKWDLEDGNGTTYTIDVREKKREIDKTPLGNELSEFRDVVISALSAPERINQRAMFLEQRADVYAALTESLPKALDAIMDRLERYNPEQPTALAAGNYLYTGRMNCAPSVEAEKKEAAELVPALRTFVHKIREAETSFYDADPKCFPEYNFLVDAVMYLDAARELERTTPRFFRDHMSSRGYLCTELTFLTEEARQDYRESSGYIDMLRGRTPVTEKESPAEKTMREVYSAHRDIVDYDKLNKLAAAKLVEKGAGDKAIREVAKIAGMFDSRITDTRAYARTLSKQAGRTAGR